MIHTVKGTKLANFNPKLNVFSQLSNKTSLVFAATGLFLPISIVSAVLAMGLCLSLCVRLSVCPSKFY